MQTKHRDAHVPNDWVDAPRNIVRHHKANAIDEKQIGAQTNKPRKKQYASNSHRTCLGTALDTFGKHNLRKSVELSTVSKYRTCLV
jgi:hypothetical protein